ncbi:hypothetical protein Chor_011540, partial [Crotalus horridus]
MTLAVYLHAADKRNKEFSGKVWIATTLPDRSVRVFYHWADLEHKHVLLSFLTQAKKRTSHYDFRLYFSSVVEYRATPFQCSHSSPVWSKKVWKRCIERESWDIPPKEVVAKLMSEDAYSIPIAIQALLQVLSAASSFQLSQRKIRDHLTPWTVQPWQLHSFLRNVQLYNLSMSGIYLDEKGDPAVDFDIVHWAVLANISTEVKVGSIKKEASSEIKLSINQSAIMWPISFN